MLQQAIKTAAILHPINLIGDNHDEIPIKSTGAKIENKLIINKMESKMITNMLTIEEFFFIISSSFRLHV